MIDEIDLDVIVEAAQALISRAGEDGGAPVSFAVVDNHGDLAYFVRMKGAPVRSVAVAINKAYTAARWGRDTGVLKKRILEKNDDLRWFGDDRYTGLPGGLVVKRDDKVIGAIGISGRTSEEDVDLGRLVVSKLQ
jgi:glc operon protein GlcG